MRFVEWTEKVFFVICQQNPWQSHWYVNYFWWVEFVLHLNATSWCMFNYICIFLQLKRLDPNCFVRFEHCQPNWRVSRSFPMNINLISIYEFAVNPIRCVSLLGRIEDIWHTSRQEKTRSRGKRYRERERERHFGCYFWMLKICY